MPSSSRKIPCSIESTPARTASLIATVECAWVATFRPRRCASVIKACISAGLYCSRRGLSPFEKTPPEAQNLMQRADCQVLRLPTERRRSNSRGSLRIVSGLAENTHSIFCDGPQGPETVNGCPVLRRQEPPPRGTHARLRVPTGSTVRAPPKRASGESFSPLTKTGSKIAFVMPDFLEVRLDNQGF